LRDGAERDRQVQLIGDPVDSLAGESGEHHSGEDESGRE